MGDVFVAAVCDEGRILLLQCVCCSAGEVLGSAGFKLRRILAHGIDDPLGIEVGRIDECLLSLLVCESEDLVAYKVVDVS